MMSMMQMDGTTVYPIELSTVLQYTYEARNIRSIDDETFTKAQDKVNMLEL